MQYVLYRIEDDSSTTEISPHASLVEGILAGKQQVGEVDHDYAYCLKSEEGCRVATFAEGRIGYREWARRSGRLEYIHSTYDRYDHDVDELIA
jgi:hypothetical protein